MNETCRWCHGTRKYQPLVGPEQECLECKVPEIPFNITSQFVGIPLIATTSATTLTLNDINTLTYHFLASAGSLTEKQRQMYINKSIAGCIPQQSPQNT